MGKIDEKSLILKKFDQKMKKSEISFKITLLGILQMLLFVT